MSDLDTPRCVEVSVTRSQGGKVAIVKYDHNSDWFISMSRRFAVPEGWDQDAIDAFQVEEHDKLKAIVDAMDTEEMNTRLEAADWFKEASD